MAPVFSRCFSARARALTLPTTSWPDPLRDVVTLSLDGLRNVAVVQSSELAFGP